MLISGKKTHNGIGLIEVLVALFIVSVSLVSMAKIINFNLYEQTNIYNKTKATLLLDDIVERIKSNPKQDYSIKKTNEADEVYDTTCEVSVCNQLQLKQYDVKQWVFNSINQLPDANVLIEKTNNKYEIKIQWNEFDETLNQVEVEINI